MLRGEIMKNKRNDKRYIFIRDGGTCHFCGKELLFKQVSIDHYLPKSKGGSDDIFNLVCSCRRCNKYKKSSVPEDYKEVMLDLFKRAVKDGKINPAGIKIKKEELINLTDEVFKVEEIGDSTVFQSLAKRFYIKDNKIYKIVRVETKI